MNNTNVIENKKSQLFFQTHKKLNLKCMVLMKKN